MAMGKRFRTDHLDQGLLLAPSLHDWLPEGHLARFIADVIEELDLGLIYQSYEGDGRGLAAYQPAMMVRLLLYGYCTGVVSSRKMERATHEDVPFRYLSARIRIRITTRSQPSANATSKRWRGCLFRHCGYV